MLLRMFIFSKSFDLVFVQKVIKVYIGNSTTTYTSITWFLILTYCSPLAAVCVAKLITTKTFKHRHCHIAMMAFSSFPISTKVLLRSKIFYLRYWSKLSFLLYLFLMKLKIKIFINTVFKPTLFLVNTV